MVQRVKLDTGKVTTLLERAKLKNQTREPKERVQCVQRVHLVTPPFVFKKKTNTNILNFPSD